MTSDVEAKPIVSIASATANSFSERPFPNLSRTFPHVRFEIRRKGGITVEGEFGAERNLLVSHPHIGGIAELAHLAHAETGGLDVSRAEERGRYEPIARFG